MYVELSAFMASKKQIQALSTDPAFLDAAVEAKRVVILRRKTTSKGIGSREQTYERRQKLLQEKAALRSLPGAPEAGNVPQHQASAVPLLTPTLLRSPSSPSSTQPLQGEPLPRPPPEVGSASERRRRRRCP